MKYYLINLFVIVLMAGCGSGSSPSVQGDTPLPPVQMTGSISLLAGSIEGHGYVDGLGQAAKFNSPTGVTLDGAGNVYVADSDNHSIRKITPAGMVTTLAGSVLASGSIDGTGASARFYDPHGVATDGMGNVYVVDKYNHTIRKITPAGAVTTLAGTAGVVGSTDGTGAAARFNNPEGIAIDGAGNAYVADEYDNTIRKITPAGVVTTLAGTAGIPGTADGTGAAARFDSPQGVATDGAGNVYVADMYSSTIRKITPTGVVTTLAGTARVVGSNDGTGAAARFNWPLGVATDGAGNVYVADSNNHSIRKITPTGVVSTLTTTDANGAAARFEWPIGVATDGAGNVYVTDISTIRKITPAGVVSTLAGSRVVFGSTDGTGAAASFYGAGGIAADGAGNVYVADLIAANIRKITPDGMVTTLAGVALLAGSTDGTGAAARFNTPAGVAVDDVGNVYVADAGNARIRKITPAGVVSTLATTDDTGAVVRFGVAGIATDNVGNLYVADGNDAIRKITPAGVVSTLAGTAVSGSTDGTGVAARFHRLGGIATDGAGNVYVADTGNATIRKITPSGVVTTLAGSAGIIGSADGTGAAASFRAPAGVATDSAGNVYVADTGNATIRKISPSGVVTTVADVAGFLGKLPGSLGYAQNLAIDRDGNLYVSVGAAVLKIQFQ